MDIRIPIYYEDTDFSGFVFHANYLKYFDRGREELLGREKLQNLYKEGRHFVVKKADLDFHKPASHGDVLLIRTKIELARQVIFNCYHSAFRESDGEKVVSGLIELVLINERGFPLRVSSEEFDFKLRV